MAEHASPENSPSALLQHLPVRLIDLPILLAVHLFAYVIYRKLFNMPFDIGMLNDMHFLSLSWLREDLLGSLWYLHSQPPLMNLLTGILVKLFPVHYPLAFEAFYITCGLCAMTLLYLALVRLGISRLPRMLVCLALAAFPTLYMYQTWAYTTHLEFTLSAAALYCLAGYYMRTEDKTRNRSLYGLFAIFCALGLLHARWHIVVMFGLAVVMWLIASGSQRRHILRAFLLCTLPLVAWYTKNLLLFGFWGASSWLGTNLVQIPAEREWQLYMIQEMRKRGEISEDFPGIYNQQKIIARVPPDSVRDRIVHMSLQPYKAQNWLNFNYVGMIDSARQDMRDALYIMQKDPKRYLLAGLRTMWRLSWRPSLSYPNTPGLLEMVRSMGYEVPRWYVYGTFPEPLRDVMESASFMLYFCIPMTLLALVAWRGHFPLLDPPWTPFVLCMLYICCGMLALSSFTNGFEQERMRWGDAPFYLAMAAMLLEILRRGWRRRLGL